MIDQVTFLPFDTPFLELTWQWLQNPELRYLTDTPSFSEEDQQRWFASLEDRADYLIWGVMVAHDPVGVVGLKNVCGPAAELFCYIGNHDFMGKGVGQAMIAHAFKESARRSVRMLYLKVLLDNARAQKAYIRAGFQKIGANSRHLWMACLIEEMQAHG
jgi:RimJ/RimL family protein N-acetyltransferase